MRAVVVVAHETRGEVVEQLAQRATQLRFVCSRRRGPSHDGVVHVGVPAAFSCVLNQTECRRVSPAHRGDIVYPDVIVAVMATPVSLLQFTKSFGSTA